MPDDTQSLLRRLIDDTPDSAGVAAVLEQANACATTTRDRQLVALTSAYLDQDDDLLDVLLRDHLYDHPDSILAVAIQGLQLGSRPARPVHLEE